MTTKQIRAELNNCQKKLLTIQQTCQEIVDELDTATDIDQKSKRLLERARSILSNANHIAGANHPMGESRTF